ncbi:MFS transporter [Acinetobacter calcoaceticus]|uniref:MFS transporter n=1 Tax=Acinetobacter calcoaceticus TaxID=471 RepID=UPI001E2DFE9F|nr:aromatic acid/H+ symport family MFS transporter [Acinetobacter calcoaceticus]UGQ31446.1 aromatic acid/H+ symport family MFS transporter [Acinetobacter calcoaceticus]
MSTSQIQRKDVKSILNENKMGGLQKLILFFCFAIIALDGLDVVVMGLIAPQIIQEWGISAQELAPVLSAALVGLAIGALVSGPLSDKFGRKPVLILSVLGFGIFTLLTAFSTDITHLLIYRFLTGLGAGAAAPNAATLVSEYAPDHRRSFSVTVAYCGFSLGAAAGGFLAAWLIPEFGWRSMLILGGVLPLILVPFLYWKMPESITYLVKQSYSQDKIKAILKRLFPQSSFLNQEIYLNEVKTEKSGLGLILSSKYRYGTIMLWISYFMALFLIYLCSSWLPTLIKSNQFTISQAAIVTSFFQIGGPVGSITLGWCMDHYRPRLVLFIAMLIGALATFGLGYFGHDMMLMCVFAWILGFTFNGGAVGLSALATGYYPTSARATGASWMNGIGRFGAILSAFAGAAMISSGMPFSMMFSLLMIPAVLSGFAVLIQGIKTKQSVVQTKTQLS